VPTKTQRDNNDLRTPMLSAVRESQTALVDLVRSWTDMTEQLTRRLPLPVAGIDVAGAVDRAFDLAEQTLAAQRQFALILVGVADRRLDSAVASVEASTHQSLKGIEDLLEAEEAPQPGRVHPEHPEQPLVATADAPTDEARTQEVKATRPDRRSFEERSVEELLDRARELEIEGRSAMSKDELVVALREHAK
jgi:hypothetical protein